MVSVPFWQNSLALVRQALLDCSGSSLKCSAPGRTTWKQIHTPPPERSDTGSSCPNADGHLNGESAHSPTTPAIKWTEWQTRTTPKGKFSLNKGFLCWILLCLEWSWAARKICLFGQTPFEQPETIAGLFQMDCLEIPMAYPYWNWSAIVKLSRSLMAL